MRPTQQSRAGLRCALRAGVACFLTFLAASSHAELELVREAGRLRFVSPPVAAKAAAQEITLLLPDNVRYYLDTSRTACPVGEELRNFYAGGGVDLFGDSGDFEDYRSDTWCGAAAKAVAVFSKDDDEEVDLPTRLESCIPGESWYYSYQLRGGPRTILGPLTVSMACHAGPQPVEKEADDCDCEVGNPIVAATGEKIQTQRDYVGSGPDPLDFAVTTRSSWATNQAFKRNANDGVGLVWAHNHGASVTVLAVKPRVYYEARVALPDGAERVFFAATANSATWTAANSADRLSYNGTTFSYRSRTDDSLWSFTAAGRVTSVRQRNGWTHTYTYRRDQLTRITNQFGRTLNLAYDASTGLLASVSAGTREVVRYTFDEDQRLIGAQYPDGTAKTYQYLHPLHTYALTGITDEHNKRLATFDYDDKGRATLTEHAGSTSRYSIAYPAQAGGPVTITDPHGTARNVQYGYQAGKIATLSVGQLTSSGIASRVQNASGLIDQETDFAGNSTRYTWDTARRLPATITQAAGRPEAQQTAIEWHPDYAVPTKITNARRVVTIGYDGAANPLTQTTTDPVTGQSVKYEWTYNAQSQRATQKAPNGGITGYGYDPQGRLTTLTDPLGHVTRYGYDGMDRLVKATQPNGLIATYGYDSRDRLSTYTAGSQTTRYTYTLSGQIQTVTLPSGHRLTYTYDDAQRMTGWSDNRGNSATYALDKRGNATDTQVKNSGGQLVWRAAQSINSLNQAQTRTLGQDATSYTYDSNGSIASATLAGNQTTRYGRDALQRVTSLTDAAQATARLVYNAQDDVTSATDYKGVATTYQRDALGNAPQEASPDIGTQTAQYDNLGLPSKVTTALGHATTTLRDLLGRPTSITYGGGTGVPSQTTTLRYDLTGASYNQSSQPNASQGHLSEIVDASGTTRYQRDWHGRVVRKTQILKNNHTSTVSYSYGPTGQLSAITYPDGKVLQHQYDATGVLTALVWNGQPLVSAIKWNALGQPTGWTWNLQGTLGSSTQTVARTYDTAGRPVQSEIAKYQYDAAGRITSVTQNLWGPASTNPQQTTVKSTPVTWAVQYDPAGRITAFNRQNATAPNNATFQYDPNGNRTASSSTRTVGNITTATNRTYSTAAANNRVLGVAQTERVTNNATGAVNTATTTLTYPYDAASNQLGNGLKSYRYDAQGRLARLTQGSGVGVPSIQYAHNALGQRVFKTEEFTSNAAAAVWQPLTDAAQAKGRAFTYGEDGSLLSEFDMQPNPADLPTRGAQHIYLPTASGPMPIAVVGEGRQYAVHADHLNTPRRLTQEDGQVAWQWVYSAFGEELPTTAAKRFANETTIPATGSTSVPSVQYNPRYPGQYFDEESGLHYNYFRSYEPKTGRYTQGDPIGLEGGWNRYSYVGANPLSFVDPYGLFEWPAIPQPIVNGVAGFGDGVYEAITLGFGDLEDVREALGNGGTADRESSEYEFCEVVGDVVGGAALGGAGATKTLAKKSLSSPRIGHRLLTENRKNGTWNTGQWRFGWSSRVGSDQYDLMLRYRNWHSPPITRVPGP